MDPIARREKSAPKENATLSYEPYSHNSRFKPYGLPDVLKLDTTLTDSVTVRFTKNEMTVSWKEIRTGKAETRSFRGKMRKKDFQAFLQRKNIVFPPVYWITNVDRLRFSTTPDSALVVNEVSRPKLLQLHP